MTTAGNGLPRGYYWCRRSVSVSGEVDRVPSWTLSTVQLLVDALSLPPLPYPLGARSSRIAPEERRRLVEPVRTDLATRGLSTNGTLVVDGWITGGGEVDLVSAVWEDRAALAVRGGDAFGSTSCPTAP